MTSTVHLLYLTFGGAGRLSEAVRDVVTVVQNDVQMKEHGVKMQKRKEPDGCRRQQRLPQLLTPVSVSRSDGQVHGCRTLHERCEHRGGRCGGPRQSNLA